jgi:hypothetical protein
MMQTSGMHSIPCRRSVTIGMASTMLFVVSILVLTGCDRKTGYDHSSTDEMEGSPNQKLYDSVMAIHNEVMPKLDDLYKAKVKLSARLKESTGITDKEQQQIAGKIARIDSASESMMVWMRQFNPIPDSLGEKKARAYLVSELAKIQKVKEGVRQALENADSAN